MSQINVDGLPDQIIRAIETMIKTLREDYQHRQREKYEIRESRSLPRVPGKVIGSLSRRDIYEDAR